MSFLFINKTLRLSNSTTRAAMNAKISEFIICVEAIIYLLLYNLHDCNFKIDSFNKSLKLSLSQHRLVKPLKCYAVNGDRKLQMACVPPFFLLNVIYLKLHQILRYNGVRFCHSEWRANENLYIMWDCKVIQT